MSIVSRQTYALLMQPPKKQTNCPSRIQLVFALSTLNIISTPADSMIQPSNRKSKCPFKMARSAAPGGAPPARNILCASHMSEME